MDEWRTRLYRYLPAHWRQALETAPACHLAQELRIRRAAPLMLSLPHRCIPLDVIAGAKEVQECFLRFCDMAVHTHQAELAQGFVTTRDGFRVGIAGTAILKDGQVVSYRDITSLCVRIPRRIDGSAAALLPFIKTESGLQSTLLCGPPASGKTTLLRDIALALSKGHRISVADERMELALGGLLCCDVIAACPKATAILQAVRTLSPDAVIADELGSDEEWRAVETSCYLGVPLIASAHIGSREEALARPYLRRLLENGGFSRVVLLPPRTQRQAAAVIWKARDFLENTGDCTRRVFLCGGGDL